MLRSLPCQTHPPKSLPYIDDGPKKTSHQRHVVQRKSNQSRWGHSPSTNRRSIVRHWGHRLLIAIGAHHPRLVPIIAQRLVSSNALRDEREDERTTGAIGPRTRTVALDRKKIFQEQERLKLLNQQLLAQVTALQNNPVQPKGDRENSRSPNLRTLNKLIQKQIREAKLLSHPTPIAKVHKSPLSKKIQECEFTKKFSTPIFDYYSRVSDLVQHICYFETRWWAILATTPSCASPFLLA